MKNNFDDILKNYNWIKVKSPAPLIFAGERYVSEHHHIEETTFLIDKCRELAETQKQVVEIIQAWLDNQGHDRCWYYPELLREIADLLGLERSVELEAISRKEFEEGCKRFQNEIYLSPNSGEVPHDKGEK